MAEVEYEYYETTPEVDQSSGTPPTGPGWELLEVFTVGTVKVHRWRRPKPSPSARLGTGK